MIIGGEGAQKRTLICFWFVQLSGWEQAGKVSLGLYMLDLRCSFVGHQEGIFRGSKSR